MADTKSIVNQTSPTPKEWGMVSLMEKVVELQEQLIQAHEHSLTLVAQNRDLERTAMDTDDLKAELAAQGLLLTDKTKENKCLHQELSRVTTILEVKLNELDNLKTTLADLQHQLTTRESERDVLAVMLAEIEEAQRRADQEALTTRSKERENHGWLHHFKGKAS